MAKITDIDITSLLFPEGSAPSTPASTKWRLYFKTTGLFHKDDAGVEIGPLGGGVVPWALIPVTGIVVEGAAASLGAANRGILSAVDIPVACQVDGVRVRVANQTGNVSAALYDSSLGRLATSGDIACPAAGGQTLAFTSGYAAVAGRYYIGISASSNSATFSLAQGNSLFGPFGGIFMETAHPLPTTFTSAGGSRAVAMAGIINGGLAS